MSTFFCSSLNMNSNRVVLASVALKVKIWRPQMFIQTSVYPKLYDWLPPLQTKMVGYVQVLKNSFCSGKRCHGSTGGSVTCVEVTDRLCHCFDTHINFPSKEICLSWRLSSFSFEWVSIFYTVTVCVLLLLLAKRMFGIICPNLLKFVSYNDNKLKLNWVYFK